MAQQELFLMQYCNAEASVTVNVRVHNDHNITLQTLDSLMASTRLSLAQWQSCHCMASYWWLLGRTSNYTTGVPLLTLISPAGSCCSCCTPHRSCICICIASGLFSWLMHAFPSQDSCHMLMQPASSTQKPLVGFRACSAQPPAICSVRASHPPPPKSSCLTYDWPCSGVHGFASQPIFCSGRPEN